MADPTSPPVEQEPGVTGLIARAEEELQKVADEVTHKVEADVSIVDTEVHKDVEDAYSAVEAVEAKANEAFRSIHSVGVSLLHDASTYVVVKGENGEPNRVEQKLGGS